jgi:hypothetical protein
MTEQNPDPQLDELESPDASPAPSPADDAKADAQVVNDGPTRFAVYDKDELRFTGGVHDTRSAADKVKSERGKDARRGRYEVREV